MILVDTSIWIDHLRSGSERLASLLERGAVLGHPWVIGELALGNLARRGEILALLDALPQSSVATDEEVLRLIDRHALHGRGIGYTDVQFLASARLTSDARLWTRDKRLARAADDLGVGYRPTG